MAMMVNAKAENILKKKQERRPSYWISGKEGGLKEKKVEI